MRVINQVFPPQLNKTYLIKCQSIFLGETKLGHLKLLYQDLEKLKETSNWDGYLCYLYGLVARKLDLPLAIQILQDSINLNPLNWAAWLELASLIKNSEMVLRMYMKFSLLFNIYIFLLQLLQLKLQDCWMKFLFMGHILGELHLDEIALTLYEKLHQGVFEHSLYIKTQIAKIYYRLRGTTYTVQMNFAVYLSFIWKMVFLQLPNLAKSVKKIHTALTGWMFIQTSCTYK